MGTLSFIYLLRDTSLSRRKFLLGLMMQTSGPMASWSWSTFGFFPVIDLHKEWLQASFLPMPARAPTARSPSCSMRLTAVLGPGTRARAQISFVLKVESNSLEAVSTISSSFPRPQQVDSRPHVCAAKRRCLCAKPHGLCCDFKPPVLNAGTFLCPT